MTDVTQGEQAASKRKSVSKRGWLNSAKEPVDAHEAVIGRYALRMSGEGDGAVFKDFDRDFSAIANVGDRMLAIFGWHTKAGNVANTVLNDKEEPGSPEQAGEAIEGFATMLDEGQWGEERVGGVGAKIDRDALAEAVVRAFGEAGRTVDKAALRQQLEDKPAMIAQYRSVPQIRQHYEAIVGKAGKSLDDLLGSIPGGAPAA